MKQNESIEQELRLAKKYWLETIQPFIKGRILRGVEFFVAKRVHWHLQEAVTKAEEWNRLCGVTRDGSRLPVSVDVDLSAENFRAPEVPKMLFADNVKPEILAAIAAPLVKKQAEKFSPIEVIRNAHELLMAAERYIGTLPRKKEGTESLIADFEVAFSTVTFAEIEASNRKDSGQLPLLPPQQLKHKGKSEKELLDASPLSLKAIKEAVRKFLEEHTPSITEEEYEQAEQQNEALAIKGELFRYGQPEDYCEWQQRNQEAFDDCLKNNRISLQDLCAMRWERFKKSHQDQQNRVLTRETKKKAAVRPTAVGKRKQ